MLKKLEIFAYESHRYSEQTGRFEAQINPEKYSETFTVEFDTRNKLNPAGITARYIGQGPRDLGLEFVLDDTGVLPDSSYDSATPRSKTVVARIKAFKEVAYEIDGSIHRPKYLRIAWGALKFDCVLKKLEIDYTLFDPRGNPLRAILKADFQHYASAEKMELEARKKSADLTHTRRVVVGDTLPLMCQRIYGDSAFYVHVARFNNLTDFRRLSVNQMLEFPPKEDLLRGTAS